MIRQAKSRQAKSRGATSKSSVGQRLKRASPQRKWSSSVTKDSDAMDVQTGVFKLKSARAIANSLKRSSRSSTRRKSSPFRSAMSLLNFEINRAGKNLSPERLRVLTRAKSELRKVFGRSP